MVEVRFKPADVGSVSDGSITDVKVNASAAIDVSKLSGVVDGTATTGDKNVTAVGWDDATQEVVVEHDA